MTRLYVIVCDSGQYEDARTEVVCLAGTKRAAERVCDDSNAVLREGEEVSRDIRRAYHADPDDLDHEAFERRLANAQRPFRKRLAAAVGGRFDAEFDGDETMRAVRADYCPRFKGGAS